MIPGSASPLLLKSAAADYQIERSLRFNSSDSAYCGRTFITPTTQGTFTFAAWVKRAALGTTQHLFGVSTNHSFGFTSGNALNLTFAGSSALTTTALFRDPSAWYHIVWTQSGTSHTLYVNNVSVGTATATSSVFNTAVAHQIGAANTANYFSGCLADIHFIDGQALTPSSFTEVSATTGQLIPKAYSGSYGTNGFYLQFADNSSNTAATLGKDTSGNSNNWTPNNLSVTAGAGNDSLVDTPTSYGTDTGVGGEVRGNYATLNPLADPGGSTFSNGNLDCVTSSVNSGRVVGTIAVSSGKWYWEVVKTGGSAGQLVGIAPASQFTFDAPGQTSNSFAYYFDGGKYTNFTLSSYGSSWTTGDVIGVALDLNTGTIVFYKNNTSQGTAFSGLSGNFVAVVSDDTGPSTNFTINFGQRAFAYTAPSGFKALCDTNIPEGTITTSGTYTGNGVADGPFVYLNGVPTAMTVGVNAVTFGTDADKLSNGFKLRTTNVLYNQNALSYSYSITTTGAKFKYARAQPNP